MKKTLEKKRRVIKVGDSLAVTLPRAYEEWGWKAGKSVHLSYIGKKSLRIDVSE